MRELLYSVLGMLLMGLRGLRGYFVFVLDRRVKGCIISFVVWRSAVCFFGKPLIARV